MEKIDFCDQLYRNIIRLGLDAHWLVRNVAVVFPDAGRYMRQRYNVSVDIPPMDIVDGDSSSSNVCKLPFRTPSCVSNAALHDLVKCMELTDLSQPRKWESFIKSVAQSRSVAALYYFVNFPPLNFNNEIQMLTIRCDDAVGILPLKIIQDREYVRRCLMELRRVTCRRRILTKNTARFSARTASLFQGTYASSSPPPPLFTNLVDVHEVALKLGWQSGSISQLSQKLTAGPYCHRGSSFTLTADTSAEAWRHEAIRVSLLHLFAQKFQGDVKEATASDGTGGDIKLPRNS